MVQRYTSEPRDYPSLLAEAYNERVRLQRRYEWVRVSGENGQREAEAESNHRTGRVVLWLLGMASVALVVVCCAGWFSPF